MSETAENGGTVRISLRDVYDAVQDLKQDLAKGLGAMETHIVAPSHSGTQTDLNDHEGRIRKLEKVAWAALGIAAMLSPVLSVLFYVLGQRGA